MPHSQFQNKEQARLLSQSKTSLQLAQEVVALRQQLAKKSEQELPEQAGDNWRHIANEWADAASNGLQWLRNVKEGISTPDDGIDEMLSNIERIQSLPRPVESQAKPEIDESFVIVEKHWEDNIWYASEMLEASDNVVDQRVGKALKTLFQVFQDKSSHPSVDSVRYLIGVVHEYLDVTDIAPDPNCSCHTAPPCGDCVEWAAWREIREALESELNRFNKSDD